MRTRTIVAILRSLSSCWNLTPVPLVAENPTTCPVGAKIAFVRSVTIFAGTTKIRVLRIRVVASGQRPDAWATRQELPRRCAIADLRVSSFGFPSCLGISSFVIDYATLALRRSSVKPAPRSCLAPLGEPEGLCRSFAGVVMRALLSRRSNWPDRGWGGERLIAWSSR